jgi:hypothetical protein
MSIRRRRPFISLGTISKTALIVLNDLEDREKEITLWPAISLSILPYSFLDDGVRWKQGCHYPLLAIHNSPLATTRLPLTFYSRFSAEMDTLVWERV